MADLEVLELTTLTSSSADDFAVLRPLGYGASGMVVAATCNRPGVPTPDKLYAVKLLYNFSHEYSSVVLNNSLENEWLVLSRLLPHPNIVRFWAQFVSPIPRSFRNLLPEELRPKSVYRDRSGVSRPRRGQFLVLDHHQKNLADWINQSSLPISYDITLKITEQVLHAVLYLEKNRVRHLDIKPSNVLIQNGNRPVLCDFGCAVQFPDSSFVLEYSRGVHVGGNRAHLAPEVLTSAHRCRHEPSRHKTIDYSKQASFAVGVLVCEIATGDHPLPDYPLGFTSSGAVQYTARDIVPLPEFFPKSFQSIVADLLRCDLGKRLDLGEAVKQLELCCVKRQRVTTVGDLQVELRRVKQERDIAKAKLSAVASERDSAVRELRAMAEQCQKVVSEFDSLAQHCDTLSRENKRYRRERDGAVAAIESAYEASHLLQGQLTLVTRERDLAQSKCEELQSLNKRASLKEPIV
ncbi:Serine/threonine-protein kinase PINK1, mitochondrial [Geodia barretti]|nr:Serine/threonine-protein kinase PINK1, mitochondrial [Geodia barretti]